MYCQVPLPLLPVIAMPFSAPVSTSAHAAPSRIVSTVVPAGVVSSFVVPSDTVAPSVIVGASLTAVTVIDAVSLAVLNAVVPPFVLAST